MGVRFAHLILCCFDHEVNCLLLCFLISVQLSWYMVLIAYINNEPTLFVGDLLFSIITSPIWGYKTCPHTDHGPFPGEHSGYMTVYNFCIYIHAGILTRPVLLSLLFVRACALFTEDLYSVHVVNGGVKKIEMWKSEMCYDLVIRHDIVLILLFCWLQMLIQKSIPSTEHGFLSLSSFILWNYQTLFWKEFPLQY